MFWEDMPTGGVDREKKRKKGVMRSLVVVGSIRLDELKQKIVRAIIILTTNWNWIWFKIWIAIRNIREEETQGWDSAELGVAETVFSSAISVVPACLSCRIPCKLVNAQEWVCKAAFLSPASDDENSSWICGCLRQSYTTYYKRLG